MTRSYSPAPKTFILSDGAEREQEISVDGPDAAAEAFWSFADANSDAEMFAVEDTAAAETFALLVGQDAVARIAGVDDVTVEYCAVEDASQYHAIVNLFFEGGFRGLDDAGRWVPDPDDLDGSTGTQDEPRGEATARSPESEAIDEVLRIWSDSGIVDPTNQYYIFFHTHSLKISIDERAELATLIDFLNLERVDLPADAAEGEVWVRTDPRIEAEIESWA